ncbi:MAG: FAD-dependent oxidoreductase [Colwellia sp.]|nr:FAD-dependent oxidoreductase [Colwellia sp.]
MNNWYSFILTCSVLALSGCGTNDNGTSEPVKTDKPPVTVIIIGAGMSGMKAAQTLSNAGVQVQILEARDRIGGRTWTDKSWDTAIDLGASWIHGIEGNPIHQLALAQNMPLLSWDYDDQVTYDTDGNIDFSIEDKLAPIAEQLSALTANVMALNEDATIGDVINEARSQGMLSGLTEQEINYLANAYFEQDTAADVDDVALAGFEGAASFAGPDVIFPRGYGELVTGLAQGLDIQLNTVVSEVNYQDAVIQVVTSQGDFYADYVIVTVPLGVLKKGVIKFTPALPSAKEIAIAALDMGVLNKVYLKFDYVFWDSNIANMAQVSEIKGHWSYWVNFTEATQQPIIAGFNVAKFGQEIEQLSDQQIQEQAMTELRKFYGNQIPEPLDVKITRWASDPYSYGSYSYVPKGATATMRDTLAEPINNKIFFAGEATNKQYPSTVHGAYLSGEREAQRILALVR